MVAVNRIECEYLPFACCRCLCSRQGSVCFLLIHFISFVCGIIIRILHAFILLLPNLKVNEKCATHTCEAWQSSVPELVRIHAYANRNIISNE